MHPLTGPYEKLVLAHHRFEAIQGEIRDLIARRDEEVFVAEREAGGEYYALRIRVRQTPPARLGALIGEFIHDLRSALDQLVWQLIILNGVNPARLSLPKPEFPIFLFGGKPSKRGRKLGRRGRRSRIQAHPLRRSQRSDTYEAKGCALIAGRVSVAHEAQIKKLQPYHRDKGRRQSLLWILHELNNADKHRLIQLAALCTNGFNGGFMFGNDAPPGWSHSQIRQLTEWKPRAYLIDGAKVGRVHRSVVEQGLDVKYLPIPGLMFWQGSDIVRGMPVESVLGRMFLYVRAIVFGDFGPSFPPSPSDWKV